MKNFKLALLTAITVISVLTISGCQKEPMKGDKGDTGQDGKDGNANVKSQSFTVSNWQYDDPSFYADINYSAITNDVITNGAVLVYFADGDGGYHQLPITLYPDPSYSKTYEIVAYVGSVRVYITDSDLTQPIAPPSTTFKIVAIGGSALKANPDLLKGNYTDIEKPIKLTN